MVWVWVDTMMMIWEKSFLCYCFFLLCLVNLLVITIANIYILPVVYYMEWFSFAFIRAFVYNTNLFVMQWDYIDLHHTYGSIWNKDKLPVICISISNFHIPSPHLITHRYIKLYSPIILDLILWTNLNLFVSCCCIHVYTYVCIR